MSGDNRSDGQIIEKIVHNALGVERVEFAWQGGDRVMISHRILSRPSVYVTRRGNLLTIGPYRLRIIDDDPCRAIYLAMRDGWKGWAWWLAYRATHVMESAYRRLIMTAAVWGLARYVDYTVPTWRDVYILDCIAKKLRQ